MFLVLIIADKKGNFDEKYFNLFYIIFLICIEGLFIGTATLNGERKA
jgi:hypothetical protein